MRLTGAVLGVREDVAAPDLLMSSIHCKLRHSRGPGADGEPHRREGR